jgi:hypothetical protein
LLIEQRAYCVVVFRPQSAHFKRANAAITWPQGSRGAIDSHWRAGQVNGCDMPYFMSYAAEVPYISSQ